MKMEENYLSQGTMGFNLCESCGMEMSQEEHEEYEDVCSDCLNEQTGGTLENDDPYRPLDFS